MKKIALALSLLTIYNGYSQVYLQGGLNLANITRTTSGETEQNNRLTTLNAGILGRFDLSKTVDLESGLLLTGQGSKAETYFTASNTDNYVKTTFNPLYIQLPLNVVVRIPLDKHNSLFFYGGPYAAIGVAGKSTSQSSFLGITSNSSNDIKFSNGDPFTSKQDDAAYDKLKRYDLGLNTGGGFDFGNLILKVNYGIGLTKINSTESNNSTDNKNKYRTLSFSIGVPLSR